MALSIRTHTLQSLYSLIIYLQFLTPQHDHEDQEPLFYVVVIHIDYIQLKELPFYLSNFFSALEISCHPMIWVIDL